jgi:anion-transporting  ArsA/GET3 family ATPase
MDPRPLQFVVGKGGVGKSTITAAVAIAYVRAGRRVLAIELGRREGLSRLLAPSISTGAEPVEIRPGLWLARVQGDDALAEYLELVVPIRRLLNIVFASRMYRYFVAAAPGLKELMAIGKIWFERQKKREDGHPLWDTIVVDAGASGQSLQYLQMPAAAARTFRKGLVHRESERVAALLSDPDTTAVHVVAIPEDMPLTEAREVLAKLEGELRLPVGTVYLNRTRAPAPDGTATAVHAIARVPSGTPNYGLAVAVHATATRSLAWIRLQDDKLDRFEREVSRRCVRLPLLTAEEFGLSEIEQLADVLARAPSGGSR